MEQSKGSLNGGVSQRVIQSLESTTKMCVLSGTYLQWMEVKYSKDELGNKLGGFS